MRRDIIKTIMVDMDYVITNGNLDKLLEQFLDYKIDYESEYGYYLQDLLKDKKDAFFDYFKTVDMYENAPLLDNCYEVLEELSKNYEIYICTDYIWKDIVPDCGHVLNIKYKYLYKTLSFIKPGNYIFTSSKNIVNCDIKIDDKLSNLSGASTKLLFTAYHNRSITDEELKEQNVIRVNNWLEIKDILLNEN